MSIDSSRNSAVSTDSEREDEARHRSSSRIAKRLKALFCCIKHEPHEEIVEYDPDEYDYIIEKLVVKRVPLALFAIRADLLDRHGSNVTTTLEEVSRSTSSSIFRKRSNTAQGTTSVKIATNSGASNHRARSSAWQEEILDKFSALHPDLKESERLPKDPRNFSCSKQSFTENVSEIASSMRTDVFSEQMPSVILQNESVHRGRPIFGFSSKRTEKSDGSRQPRYTPSERDRGNCLLGLNRRYIVSPFRVQKNSFDLEKRKNVDEDIGINCKSLTYLEESVEEKTLQLEEASKDKLPNRAVRWRITIRRQRANANSEVAASEGECSREYVASCALAAAHLHLCSRTCGRCRGDEDGNTMAAIEIFSSSVSYKYKNRIHSFASIAVLLLIVLSLITPLFIVYHAGGVWLRNRMHAETPDVHFEYKYLLLAEVSPYEEPIVCTTFTTYKENEIADHCTIIKVRENDLNGDGQKDSLKFEAHFYTEKPVKSIRLLLFFNFQLKHLIQATIESIGVFDYALSHEAQEIRFFGDLELRQKGLLRSEGLYETYNHSIELSDYSLSELLLYNFNRKFSARIANEHVTWRSGFSSDETVAIIGELFYAENFIHYQPSVWEELKWAWVQYLSCLLVFTYVSKHILVFLFTNRYLNTYIVKPWANK